DPGTRFTTPISSRLPLSPFFQVTNELAPRRPLFPFMKIIYLIEYDRSWSIHRRRSLDVVVRRLQRHHDAENCDHQNDYHDRAEKNLLNQEVSLFHSDTRSGFISATILSDNRAR